MKKIFSVVFSIILIISIFTVLVHAASVSFTGSNSTCNQRDEVTVSFSINANSYLAAADFTVKYDSTAFTYVDYETGNAFSNGLSTANKVKNGEFKYAFISSDGTKKGGIMFSVIFEATSNAVKGKKYSFSLTPGDLADKDINPISGNSTVAYVTINGSSGGITSTVTSTPKPPVSTSSNVNTSSKVNSSVAASNSITSSTDTESAILNSSVEGEVHPDIQHHITETNTDTDTDITGTDIDSYFFTNDKTLFITIIALSVIALSLLITMIVLIIKAYSTIAKEN